MPLIAVVGAVFQAAFHLWGSHNFDRTLETAARSILTGQFQAANTNLKNTSDLLTAFKAKLCGPTGAKIPTIFNCQNVKIDISIADMLTNANASSPFNATTGTWNANFGTNYTCAKPGAIVIITAAVPVPTFFNVLGFNTKKFTTGVEAGSGLLISTVVFRTEPYQIVGASPC